MTDQEELEDLKYNVESMRMALSMFGEFPQAKGCLDAAQKYLAHYTTIKAIESGEYVLVPREPTEAMRRALTSQYINGNIELDIEKYKTMIAAAQTTEKPHD